MLGGNSGGAVAEQAVGKLRDLGNAGGAVAEQAGGSLKDLGKNGVKGAGDAINWLADRDIGPAKDVVEGLKKAGNVLNPTKWCLVSGAASRRSRYLFRNDPRCYRRRFASGARQPGAAPDSIGTRQIAQAKG